MKSITQCNFFCCVYDTFFYVFLFPFFSSHHFHPFFPLLSLLSLIIKTNQLQLTVISFHLASALLLLFVFSLLGCLEARYHLITVLRWALHLTCLRIIDHKRIICRLFFHTPLPLLSVCLCFWFCFHYYFIHDASSSSFLGVSERRRRRSKRRMRRRRKRRETGCMPLRSLCNVVRVEQEAIRMGCPCVIFQQKKKPNQLFLLLFPPPPTVIVFVHKPTSPLEPC